eukprot:g13629.t1
MGYGLQRVWRNEEVCLAWDVHAQLALFSVRLPEAREFPQELREAAEQLEREGRRTAGGSGYVRLAEALRRTYERGSEQHVGGTFQLEQLLSLYAMGPAMVRKCRVVRGNGIFLMGLSGIVPLSGEDPKE